MPAFRLIGSWHGISWDGCIAGFASGENLKMFTRRLTLPLALGVLLAPAALADQVTLQASKDNTLFEDSTFSNGAGSYFFAGVLGANGNFKKRRALLAFDI